MGYTILFEHLSGLVFLVRVHQKICNDCCIIMRKAYRSIAINADVLEQSWWVIKWKHFPRYWPFVWGIHRSPVNFPHKGKWRGALKFSLICVWINGWVNNREAGDLIRYRAHYEVSVEIRSFAPTGWSLMLNLNHPRIYFNMWISIYRLRCESTWHRKSERNTSVFVIYMDAFYANLVVYLKYFLNDFTLQRWTTDYSAWWRHQMETFSALLAIFAGNSQVIVEFPS